MNGIDGNIHSGSRSGRRFAAGHKILLVEDEGVVAWDLEELLREHGAAQVLSCATLGEARQLLSAHADISCAVLDLKLQDGFGGDLIDEMISRRIPVIVSTGYSGFERSGVRVLSKPYSSDLFLDAVFSALGL